MFLPQKLELAELQVTRTSGFQAVKHVAKWLQADQLAFRPRRPSTRSCGTAISLANGATAAPAPCFRVKRCNSRPPIRAWRTCEASERELES